MTSIEWCAKAYEEGAYIQSTVATPYLESLPLRPTDRVLDIGCGDGAFSLKVIEKLADGQFTGIDASSNMLKLAREKMSNDRRANFFQLDVLNMQYERQFDYVVSFWCLQWVGDFRKAYEHIYRALVPGGKFMTLLPTGDDPFVATYRMVRDSGQFPQLQTFIPPINYENLQRIDTYLSEIPFHHLNVQRMKQCIELPSLDVFRKFINGITFYNTQLPESLIPDINEAMVSAYDKLCQDTYQGAYCFEFSVFLITGER